MAASISSVLVLSLQLLFLSRKSECQFRIPPIKTTVFGHTVSEPMADSYGGQQTSVPSGQEFTLQIHLDQTPSEDDYDIFVSECSANGIPFMDSYGCAITSQTFSPVSMTREMNVIRKDDNRLMMTSYKNDKFTFLYLRANSASGGSVQVLCSIKYVDCQSMTCQRQPGCTNYMSATSVKGVETTAATATVTVQSSENGRPEVEYPNPNTIQPYQPTQSPPRSDGFDGEVETAGIAWWHIALICIVALLLFVVVVVLLIVLCCRKKDAETGGPVQSTVPRPSTRIYEEVYEPKYYTPSENASHATYAPTNVSQSRVALAAYNNRHT